MFSSPEIQFEDFECEDFNLEPPLEIYLDDTNNYYVILRANCR